MDKLNKKKFLEIAKKVDSRAPGFEFFLTKQVYEKLLRQTIYSENFNRF